ncbi:MAG: hypothetical protein NC210_04485 [[Clostridium] fimetarium]|nr:hypothetical protein [Alistipes timonensis]MCM1405661.1 hypothetical protein [[Clostridium] fimetarium]
MKKFSALVMMFAAFNAAQAQDFTVLSAPEEVLANSVEDEAGAKAQFEAVLSNTEATEAEKTEAMHLYMQLATPAAGYGFDMSWLLSYNAVTADNKGKYTKAKLAEVYKTDVEGLVFGPETDTFTNYTTEANGTYLRVNDTSAFKAEASFGKFIVYQNATLSAGEYLMTAKVFAQGSATCATLSAGNVDAAKTVAGSPMKDYEVSFSLAAEETIKLGFKRNSTAGNLTQVAFNDLYLYKVSNIVEISDASGDPVAATGVNVIVKREFEAGRYYPICLPFVVENWREVFADLLLWNDYENGNLSFKTVSGANTQARKPYMVKFDEAITADNYLMFKNVTIQKGNAGSWLKSVEEGAEAFPVKMQGNWAATSVPAKCYAFDGAQWVLGGADVSRAAGELEAYSAYIDASGLENCPATMVMKVNGEVLTGVSVAEADAAPAIVNVYNIQGIAVKTGVSEAEALEGLPRGLYIVNGKKIVK